MFKSVSFEIFKIIDNNSLNDPITLYCDEARFQDHLRKPVPECLHSGFSGAMNSGGGDDNWNNKTCNAPVKSLTITNQDPTFYRPFLSLS